MNALNPLQLEILKLFSNYKSENELRELKELLVNYLSKKVVQEADAAFEAKNYDTSTIEQWKKSHVR